MGFKVDFRSTSHLIFLKGLFMNSFKSALNLLETELVNKDKLEEAAKKALNFYVGESAKRSNQKKTRECR